MTQVKKAARVSSASLQLLGAHEASPAIARGHVARLIDGRATAEQCGIAGLVVSELVTNAVMYGREPIRLSLRVADDFLRVEVMDGNPDVRAVASPRVEGDCVVSGRGLRIVDALARAWGVSSRADGKCVWAAVAMRAPRGR